MTDESVVAIAQIPLARSRARVLAAPALLLLAGAVAVVAGAGVGEWPGLGLLAGGVLLVAAALYLATVVLTVRLDVEVSTLRLRWFGTDKRLTLVRGPVTRAHLRGEGAARLRPRLGAFGWGLGTARLRGSEDVQVVRLAGTPSVILIPTDAGRVAVAPRSEEQLIGALTAAARVQQRLDQVAARARAVPLDRLVQEPQPAPAPAPPVVTDAGRVLTGIERVFLEERLAAERAAALAAAEAERRRAVAEAAAQRAAEGATVAEAGPLPAAQAPTRPRVALPGRPGWLRLPRPRLPLPPRGALGDTHLAPFALATLPLVLAAGIWGYATLSGGLELPEPRVQLASLALALGGPAGALGALVVRAWFPRLLGLVTLASLCALALVGRALIG